MQKAKMIAASVLEGFAYGVLGAGYWVAVILAEEYFREPPPVGFGYGHHYEPTIPALGWLLIGLSGAAFLGKLLFNRITISSFFYWLHIQSLAAVSAVLMQQAFLIFYNNQSIEKLMSHSISKIIWEVLGLELMINTFLILTPFTILFAALGSFIKKIRLRNSLK